MLLDPRPGGVTGLRPVSDPSSIDHVLHRVTGGGIGGGPQRIVEV